MSLIILIGGLERVRLPTRNETLSVGKYPRTRHDVHLRMTILRRSLEFSESVSVSLTSRRAGGSRIQLITAYLSPVGLSRRCCN